MTIEELKKAKRELEMQLSQLVNQFNRSTGTTVEDISIKSYYEDRFREPVVTELFVTLDLRL